MVHQFQLCKIGTHDLLLDYGEVVRRHLIHNQSSIQRFTLERLNQIIEDIIRACILDFSGGWDTYLYLVKFSHKAYKSTLEAVHNVLHVSMLF